MNYFKEINKRFNIFNCIFLSVIITIMVFLIDYYNLPSYIYNKYKIFVICFVILFICYFVKEFISKKIWKLLYIETINYFDKLLFITILSEIELIVLYMNKGTIYKTILFIVIGVSFIVFLFKLIRIEKLIKKSKEKDTNIYNIADLYNNSINKGELILLEEKALLSKNEDLLDMSLFVDSIEDSLLHCKPKDNFVISLIGKWGCGKTSVINLLKDKINRSDNSTINTFNPWKYDNKLSLFEGFYNFIFKTLGKNFGYFNYNKLLKKFESTIFSLIKDKTSISLNNLLNINDEKDIEEIKNNINDCISFNNKKVIVVIDDIDRLDKEQILLVFKTIKTLFNFNNIIYILCYDEERINNIFEKELKIDADYLNKIVQNKIVMPKIENDKLCEIGNKCIINLLDIYDIKKYDKNRLSSILNLIFKNFDDLREVIRYINTISISLKCCDKLQLDICDYLALEFVKFQDLSLYNNIYNNSKMFVSQDVEFNVDYDYFSSERFNEKAKEFYNNIFKGKENMLNLLIKVFPYLERYENGNEIKSKYFYITDERKKSIVDKRCFNGRYFKCYFMIRHSFFTELSNLIDNFVKNINVGNDIDIEFGNIVKEVNSNNHDLLFELLEIRLSEIFEREKIFNYVLNNLSDYENKTRFLGLNSNERAKIILSSIINLENEKSKKEDYFNLICKKNLILLDSVLYWLGTDKYGNTREDEIYKYGKKLLCKELENIVDKKINIFDDDKFDRHFCWLFHRNFDDNEKYKKYLKSLININNVFKVIGECVGTWIGNGISYEYKQSSLKDLVELDDLDDTLNKVDYLLNKDQEKVKELYLNKNEKQFLEEINFNNL